jgi:hypothetical protein
MTLRSRLQISLPTSYPQLYSITTFSGGGGANPDTSGGSSCRRQEKGFETKWLVTNNGISSR